MVAQRLASVFWWVAVLLLAGWLASGCASGGLEGAGTLDPRATGGPQTHAEGGHASSHVRRIDTGMSRGVMKEVQVGKMPDGYLVTVTWTNNIRLVRMLCLNSQAVGCQQSEQVTPGKNHAGYRRQSLVLYVGERMSDFTLETLTHEICHAVASSQNLQPDPCHNENAGRIAGSK